MELARSNKKVKDIHHANFNEDTRANPFPSRVSSPSSQGKKSFRDKLIGEIPGAYAEAFDLADQMEEDPDSDDDKVDIGDLSLVGEERRIRGPWSKAIIIKLVGKMVGFSYLQSKLTQLWKPSGRMDCVDLTYGFFLVRFHSKEDLDNVIKKGPWFIGDHLLSLRAWEPLIKPSSANVSLVAVWVRLNKLPIELYKPGVLKEIGESIKKVLRIDSHTAMEAKGKYARMCIQVDLNKVIIGRFEQRVTYEGIEQLCFSYGRVGHKAKNYPYTIKKEKNPLVATEKGYDIQSCKPCVDHEDTPIVCEEGEPKGQYDPWMVVHRKRYGRKGATLGKKLEGTSAHTYPLPPSPEHLGRMSSNVFGPTLKKSTPHEDTPHNSD